MIRCIPLFLVALTTLLIHQEINAATLYSRKSGNWNDNNVTTGTWSTLGFGMASCGCQPSSSDSVIIASGNTVDLNVAGNVRSITVIGSLRWTSGVALNLSNSGLATINSGGSLDRNGQADANVALADASSVSLVVNTGGTVDLGDINIDASGTITISGGGNITLLDDINFNAANSTLVNNLSGNFTVTSSIVFRPSSAGSLFTNNDSVSVAGYLYFDDINNTVTNSATGVLNLLTSGTNAGIRVQSNADDGNVVNNQGTVYLAGNLTTTQSDFTFNNSGLLDMEGDLANAFSGADSLKLLAGSTWKMGGGNPGGVEIFADYGSNTVEFDGSGTFWLAPQDAYWDVVIHRRADIGKNITVKGTLTVSDTVSWQNSRTVTMSGSSVTINTNGCLEQNGQTTAALNFTNAGTNTLTVNGGGGIDLEDIQISASGTLNISGSGNITLSDDLNISAANVTINNNLSGDFTINSSLVFQPGSAGSSFTNNDSLAIGGYLYFNDINNTFTNGASGVVNLYTSGSSAGIRVNDNADDGNVFDNYGKVYLAGDLSPAQADFTFNNRNFLDMDGDLSNAFSGADSIKNLSGATWYMGGGNPGGVGVYTDYDANTVIFDGAGTFWFTSDDAYWHVTINRQANFTHNTSVKGNLIVNDTVSWTNNNRTLTMLNGGTVTINNNGLIERNGNAMAPIVFGDASTFGLVVNAGGKMDLEDISLDAAATLNISGAGDISLLDDINFNAANGTVTNSLSGTFALQSSIAFRSNSCTFTNNDSIVLGLTAGVLYFNGTNNTFTNGVNGILNMPATSTGIQVADLNDDNTIINNNGTMYIAQDILVNDAEFTFNNSGTVDMDGEFKNFPASGTRDIHNLAGATWYCGSTSSSDADMRLFCNYANNTFVFDKASAQLLRMPQDAFWNLTFSGGGWRRPTGTLDINGNLTINSGTEFDVNTNTVDVTIAGNWVNNGGTFTEGSQTVTFDGSSLQTITGNETFNNLTLNNTAAYSALTLNNPVTINGTLTLTDGHVNTTGTNLITMGSASTLTLNATPQDSSFVRGPFNWTIASAASTQKTFPVGKATELHQVDLTVDHDAATSTIYTGEVFNSAASGLGHSLPVGIDHVSHTRYWTINKGAGAGIDNASVKLYYVSSDQVNSPSNLRVVKDDGAGNWVNLGGTGSGSPSGEITSVGFTSFSDFALASSVGGPLNPLPVELLYFKATVESSDKVKLEWTTTTEINNSYFTIERSADGIVFEKLIDIPGAGNSTSVLNYTEYDTEPFTGTSYYRLKQTDFDGSFSYSRIIGVKLPELEIVKLYPNPSVDDVEVLISSNIAGDIRVNVYNHLGQRVFEHLVYMHEGLKKITIPSTDYLQGIYNLEVITTDGKYRTFSQFQVK